LTIVARDAVGHHVEGFLYSPLAVVVDALTLRVASSERQEVAVLATGSIAVQGDTGTSGSRGGTTQVGSLSGSQVITDPVDASGNDISVRANDIDIEQSVRSAGGVLNLATLDPGATIVLGDLNDGTNASGWMVLDGDDLSNLQDGFREIVVGGENASGHVMVGDSGSDSGVTLNDTLHIQTPVLGGHVYINTDLVLQGSSSLIIEGSGNTTSLNAGITVGDDINVIDSVQVTGAQVLTAGTDGSGSIQLGGNSSNFVDGDGVAGDDTLTLYAPGNISVEGDIGATDALEGLTIGGVTVAGSTNLPNDVTFHGSITLDGDLRINASAS